MNRKRAEEQAQSKRRAEEEQARRRAEEEAFAKRSAVVLCSIGLLCQSLVMSSLVISSFAYNLHCLQFCYSFSIEHNSPSNHETKLSVEAEYKDMIRCLVLST